MKKLKYLLIIPIIVISIHFYFYNALKLQYVVDDTVNPKATSYFLHSTAITAVWINSARIYLGLQYDGIILKPIVSLRDYFFEQGKKYVKKDNAEDVMWWTINYPRMYGFYDDDKQGNNLYIRNLNDEKHKQLIEIIKSNIVRLGSNEVYGVKTNELDDLMDILLNGYDIALKSMKKRITPIKFWNSKIILKDMKDTYNHSNQIFNKNIKKENLAEYIFPQYRLLSQIIYANMMQGTQKCNSKYTKEFLLYYLEMAKWVMLDNSKENNRLNLLKKSSFSNDKKQIPTYLLNIIDKKCPKYKKQTTILIKIIKQQGEKNGNN